MKNINVTMSSRNRNFCYIHIVPKLHIIIKVIPLTNINEDLIDFLIGIGEYLIIEGFSYIRLYGSKLLSKAPPVQCIIFLLMLEVVR